MTTTTRRSEILAAIAARSINDATRGIGRLRLTHAEADTLGADALAWLRDRVGMTVRETDRGVEISDRRQTLPQAMAACREAGSDMARAACALDGCPVGGWAETAQAMRQIAEYLPPRAARAYTVDEFVAAAYYVDHADRYRAL